MSKEPVYEAAAYENDKDTAKKLVQILKDCEITDSYTEYDEISASYIIYVNNKNFSRADIIIKEFYEDREEESEDGANNSNTDSDADDGSGTGFQPAIYANSTDRYKDNLSSAYTFFVFGTIGIIVLVLYDLGFIPVFSMALPSKILFNVVMGILFVGFIAAGAFSLKYSRRLKLQIDVWSAKTDDVMEYLNANLTKETIDASFDGEGMPDEIRCCKRIDAIKKCITDEFGEQPEEFINDICDSYYNSLFGE